MNINKIFYTQWRLSGYAIFIFIGGVIGSSLVNPSLASILGALTGSLLLVVANVIYVIFKKKRKAERSGA